jgi:tRNA pseudouridine38-40 synthase
MAAIVEYDGKDYAGWQSQAGVVSVQETLEAALGIIADEPVRIVVAGRTDAGVHACGQVFHYDTEADRTDHSWVYGTNSRLSAAIALRWAGRVNDDFHARYSAIGRHYHYLILNRRVRPTFLVGHVTHEYRPLDVELMNEAATFLLGEHDFSSFRATQCQAKSPVREVRSLTVVRHGDLVRIQVHANAFLHHMVRNMAGVLMTVGAGERPAEWVREILQARHRTAGGVTAPPDGLYLTKIEYPEHFGVPQLPPIAGLW